MKNGEYPVSLEERGYPLKKGMGVSGREERHDSESTPHSHVDGFGFRGLLGGSWVVISGGIRV